MISFAFLSCIYMNNPFSAKAVSLIRLEQRSLSVGKNFGLVKTLAVPIYISFISFLHLVITGTLRQSAISVVAHMSAKRPLSSPWPGLSWNIVPAFGTPFSTRTLTPSKRYRGRPLVGRVASMGPLVLHSSWRTWSGAHWQTGGAITGLFQSSRMDFMLRLPNCADKHQMLIILTNPTSDIWILRLTKQTCWRDFGKTVILLYYTDQLTSPPRPWTLENQKELEVFPTQTNLNVPGPRGSHHRSGIPLYSGQYPSGISCLLPSVGCSRQFWWSSPN